MRLTESLTIRPAATEWRALIRRNTSPDALAIRRELGLSLDRPVILTGHQAEFWHPGILAKYLAADAAAVSLGAQPAWVVVDQDRAESATFRYPVRRNSRLAVATATIKERGAPGGQEGAAGLIQPRLQHLLAVFLSQAPGPLSRRIAGLLADLMRPYLDLHAPTIFATTFCRTTLFQTLIDKMRQDPESCILAYNAAARRHPTAHIRPLIADDIQDRWELPLWYLPPGAPRRHVYAEMLGQVPHDQLAPKALFMTALMRLAACDLMIHGTGGGGGDDTHEGYDIITEEWLERWLGVPRSQLAPMAVVTATRYLPLATEPPPSVEEVAHARWLAHHARHDPGLLHDAAAAHEKRRLFELIHTAHRHSHERHDRFADLHRLLDSVRRAHAADLTALETRSSQLCARFDEREIICDRTWPFALYPAAILQDLRSQIRSAFGLP